MLKFKLISYQTGFYHYEIYPEGKIEDKGWIIFNPETGVVTKRVEPNSSFNCIGHFLNSVQDDQGHYRETGAAAWY